MKFRKKPVVIEAVQWKGISQKDWEEVKGFCPALIDMGNAWNQQPPSWPIAIRTLESTMVANIGDWIIEGVSGEFYPCKPDIFEKTYEPV